MRPLIVTALCLVAGGCGGGGSGSVDTAAPQIPLAGQTTTRTAPQPVTAARGVRLIRIGTFNAPTYLSAPPGDTHHLFVVEQEGTIRVLRDRRILTSPFLDIHRDVSAGGERGLLSMAFAPDYATSGLFYVYFTGTDGDIRIQEFRASKGNAERADVSTRRELLRIEHSAYTNHNGGQLQFGPDGLLYAGIGDGGDEGDPFRRGQNLKLPYAKILRFDPHATPVRPETYAYGLRNPWRFSFDRQTGDLVIADVGQDAIEEVDFSPAGTPPGRNYGWSVFEGRSHYNHGAAPGAIPPVIQRLHSQRSCSITGGYVVRDHALASLYGRYVYGDYCDPALRAAKLSAGHAEGDRRIGLGVQALSSFGEDASGRVYAVSLAGSVYRLAPT
jgi:glucose/arabinose dehydrogenase